MKFTHLHARNFKCYSDADLRLDTGVTVIHGLNGSGKSSLLEACFFALYGSKALDGTIEEIVSIGAEDAAVELGFTHAGGDYHIERQVRVREERAVTARAVLETPSDTFEGARAVHKRITELLRMDHDAFVNCAYVRQGEVNKLINASPADRQDMLDDLLQLGKLETYRERASEARVGVGRVRDGKQDVLENLDDQIEQKEDKELHQRLNELKTEVVERTTEIEHTEDQREQAMQTRGDARSILDEYEEKREVLTGLEDDVSTLRERIAQAEQDRNELNEQLRDTRKTRDARREELQQAVAESDVDSADPADVDDAIADCESDDDELQERITDQSVEAKEHDSTADSLRNQASEAEERAESRLSEAEATARAVKTNRVVVAEKRDQLESLEEERQALSARFEDAAVDRDTVRDHRDDVASKLDDVRKRATELETTLKNEREALAEAEQLREQGRCPECGQDVDGSPHVEAIEEDRERIETLEADLATVTDERDEREQQLERVEALVETAATLDQLETDWKTLQTLVDEKESGLDADEERIRSLGEQAAELKSTAAEKRETAAERADAADDCRSVIAECNEKRQALRERIAKLERIDELIDEVSSLDDSLDRLRESYQQTGETNDERRERLAEKRERMDAVADEFDDERVEQAQNELDRATEYVEKADEKLATLREQHSELQSQVGAVENEIEELEAVRDQRDDLDQTLSNLESLYGEVDDLQEMYGTLRAELRQRNVETLERMVNETFDLLYQNDSYSHIELDGEYQLTVYQKDGEALDPEHLSGGERALFNLSLRCAIYRLLADGIEGAAPMPPLIFDEPTVFLDSGHVTQLLDVIAYMRDDVGVEQTVVVSHDDELVGAADNLVRVEKDATTNRSSVDHVEPGLVAGLDTYRD